MKWQLPAGVAAILLLLLLYVPVWNALGEQMVGVPPPPGAGTLPPIPPLLVPTETEVTEQPEMVRKGEPFLVEGVVRERDTGLPAKGVTVALFLNESKDEPGVRVGFATTDEQGVWRIEPELDAIEARDYQVVAFALPSPKNATHGYEFSWSDPPLRVVAATELALEVPRREAYNAPVEVRGALHDSTGEPVPGAAIQVEAEGLGAWTVSTGPDGTFAHTLVFPVTGNYTVRAAYAGTPNLEPAEAAARIEIADVVVALPDTMEAVRGQPLTVAGEVRFGTGTEAGVELAVHYHFPTLDPAADPAAAPDFGHASLVATDAAGRFEDTRRVAPGSPLGTQLVRVTMDARGLSHGIALQVRAQPTLVLEAPLQVEADAPVQVRLVDDLGAPLAGVPVVLEARQAGRVLGSVEATTDALGVARATVPTGGALGTAELAATFPGQGDYLPASAAQPVQVTGLLSLVLAVLGFAIPVGLLAWWRHTHPPPEGPRPALVVEFPDVPAGLPAVAAPGEAVRVGVRLLDPEARPVPGAAVRLGLGSHHEVLTTDAEGHATVERRFAAEGEVAVTADADLPGGQGAWAATMLRVADYRKEAGRLWDELRYAAARRGVPAAIHLGPRELEERLAAAGVAPEALAPLVAGFEHAQYSPRGFGRDAFLAFLQAQRDVLARVEALPAEGTAQGGGEGAAAAA